MPIGNETCNGKTEAVSIAFLMRKVVIISGEIGNGTVFQENTQACADPLSTFGKSRQK
jgi:hypothetical protein